MKINRSDYGADKIDKLKKLIEMLFPDLDKWDRQEIEQLFVDAVAESNTVNATWEE